MIEFEDASYLVTGGTGGLGRSLVRWLAGQGARYIITASRSGIKGKEVSELKEQLRGMGVSLAIKECDVGDRAQVESLIVDCQASLPPIKGVIHGAMALRDALFEKIGYDDWNSNIKPRVPGAWNLHHCLAENNLDFFVILASFVGLFGQAGQGAYAASNTFLDSFSAHRNNMGLPTSVIDVGYVAERPDTAVAMMAGQLTEAEVISLVRAHITRPEGFQSPREGPNTHGLPARRPPTRAPVLLLARVCAPPAAVRRQVVEPERQRSDVCARAPQASRLPAGRRRGDLRRSTPESVEPAQ